MLQKLIIPPDRDAYAFLEPKDVISVALDGGASRYRLDILDSNLFLSVQWTLDQPTYNYMKTFYKILLEKGSLPFLIDLYIDNPFELTEHECHFVPGSFGLRSQRGYAFVVGATLEVKPVEMTQENIDKASVFALFGDQWQTYTDAFDNLINVQIPADLA